jgi:hypothetical protein
MSEQNLAPMMDDMELISLYINEQLPDDQMEQVRERLNADEEFRYLAEPMIFASAVLRQEMSRPRPAGELEKHWNAFTRRAGFAHQKQRARARRWWIIGIVLAAAGIGTMISRDRIQGAYRDWRDFAPVAVTPDWLPLRDNIQVRLEPGTQLRAAKELRRDVQHVKLARGTAHFRVELTDTTNMMPATRPLVVTAGGSEVFSGYGNFTVTTSGDTTIAEEHEPVRQRYVGFMPFPSMTLVRTNDYSDPMRIQTGWRVRLVPGSTPERIP